MLNLYQKIVKRRAVLGLSQGNGWLWETDENWGSLGLRENFMHFWTRCAGRIQGV